MTKQRSGLSKVIAVLTQPGFRFLVFLAFVVLGLWTVGKSLVYFPDGWPTHVPSSTAAIRLPCAPKAFEVTVLGVTGAPQIIGARRVGSDGKVVGAGPTYVPQVVSGEGAGPIVYTMTELPKSYSIARDSMQPIVVNVAFDSAPSLDLQGVRLVESMSSSECHFPKLSERRLFEAVISDGKSEKYMRQMQGEVGDWVFKFNDLLGNVLLIGMFLYAVWSLGYVATAAVSRCAPNSAHMRVIKARYLEVKSVVPNEELVRIVEADHCALEERLRFAQSFGPALGFLLTVSSLIAALHPSIHAERDSFRFVSSLQLAMVGTLLGLTIRVFAEFALRLSRQVARRRMAIASSIGAES